MYKSITDPEYGRLVRARSRLGSKAPGYASIVFGLPLVETTATDTMATDGSSMFWNRAFVQSTPDAELEAVVLHEGLHVVLMHHLLRGDINPDLWNQACDYAINLIVWDANLPLPSGALFDPKYRGLSAKQIAKMLGDQEGDQQSGGEGDQTPQGDDKPSGAPENPTHAGEIWDATDEDGERLSGDALEEATEAIRRDIIVASEVEKVTGSGTINISDGVLDAAKAATVDWKEALADFLSKAFGEEPTLARPNRRFIGGGDYFPSTEGVGGGDLYDEFTDYSDIEVENKSGGGTRFEPPFKLCQQEGIDPAAFIYFTDGYASLSKEVQNETHFPVLWASTGVDPRRGDIDPFGEFVKVEM